MNILHQMFLEALGAGCRGQAVAWPEDALSAGQWSQLLGLAWEHRVLPLVYEAAYRCPAALHCQELAAMRKQIVSTVLLQTTKTQEFLELVKYLEQQGLRPLLVKGMVCRSLYPKPDYRMSSDEDLLVPEAEFTQFRSALEAYGMRPGAEDGYEVPYIMPESPLYIELHRSLFPPENEAYGDLNRFFENIHSQAVAVELEGARLWTMPATEHLFYLICHAFKHFLHSGFGIRQVCDICLFAEKYGQQIDFAWVLTQCRAIHAQLFAAAIFQIGSKHLGLGTVPEGWRDLHVDEGLLLEDLLDAGVYGGSTMDRRHSSSMTLNAVAARKKGKKGRGGLLRTVFPGVEALKGRYPYLADRPWFLPVAWVQRLAGYGRENRNAAKNAAASVSLGKRRIALMEQYEIISDT